MTMAILTSASSAESRPRPGRRPPMRRRGLKAARHLRSGPSPLLDTVTVVLVTVLVLLAVVGPLLAPDVYSSHIDLARQAPSGAHWLGTDDQGRDIGWRIVVGARATLLSSVVIVAGYALLGTLVAVAAALGPRLVDEALMRFTDVVLAFPGLIFALAVTAALGAGLKSAIVALVLTGWPMTARLLRGIIAETSALPYVEGARTLGVGPVRLMARHVLPNSLPAVWVKWAGDIGNTVLVIGALSFVGAGAQPPSAEWGAMVNGARGYVSTAWWTALFPGLAIAVTTAAFGLLGDMLHLRTDPALRARAAAAGAAEAGGPAGTATAADAGIAGKEAAGKGAAS
ncbi:putative peptide ABC transporter permease [Actinacidiphila reveromycinica]|uniref:Putative peptide ABC transporter permease n=1 Tax=Actinacidiphila reveromycinica TaxID=659352 RepID=A0A7U3V0X1_9ACTN|nr:ABC transporter permease [Streptomyces sp. SN-593]BBB02315.1 putative peptide ABC transporter permease [Streptomyces sp. SN-593]